MAPAYALALKSPHQSLGLPVPFGRKLESLSKRLLIIFMASMTAIFVGVYLYQVDRAASKSFTLRNLEKQMAELKIDVESLENSSARLQSLSAIETRVAELGYVRVERPEFVDVPTGFARANP